MSECLIGQKFFVDINEILGFFFKKTPTKTTFSERKIAGIKIVTSPGQPTWHRAAPGFQTAGRTNEALSDRHISLAASDFFPLSFVSYYITPRWR